MNNATIVESRTTARNHLADGGAIPASSLHFRTGRRQEAEQMVLDYHYSRTVRSMVQREVSRPLAVGLLSGDGGMVASALFCIPPIAWKEKVIELARLVRGDDRVSLTFLLARCSKELKRHGHDLLVSFADMAQGHDGVVYRAANWKYAGLRAPRIDGVMWNGKFINQRQCRHLWGNSMSSVGVIDRTRQRIAGTIEPHYDEGKHCYWLALGRRGEEKAARLGLTHRTHDQGNRLKS